MNIYDKKQICCISCGRYIGEVEEEARILLTVCSQCSDTGREENEIFSYIADRFENTVKNVMACR